MDSSHVAPKRGRSYSLASLAVGKTPAQPGSISEVERVKEGMMAMLRERQLVPGQRLDQRKLARHLESSTAPLREALSSLEAEGILVREPGMGVFCRSYTVREIEELIEIRGVLEGLAARWASLYLTPAKFDELRELALELEKPFGSEGEAGFVRIHVDFHKRIVEGSRSKMLASLIGRHHFIDTVIGNVSPALWRVEPHDHHTLVDALASGDPQQAEAAMRAHIAPTFRTRLEGLRKVYGEGWIFPIDPAG